MLLFKECIRFICAHCSNNLEPGQQLLVTLDERQLSKNTQCLDLAAGSGEATQAVEMWWASRKVEEAKQLVLLPPPHSGSKECGMQEFAKSSIIWHSTKPTAAAAAAASERRSAATNEQAAALLSAGSADENVQGRGDPTPAQAHLASRSPTNNPPAAAIKSQLQLCIDAADPFTGAAYLAWTGKQAQAYSFEVTGGEMLRSVVSGAALPSTGAEVTEVIETRSARQGKKPHHLTQTSPLLEQLVRRGWCPSDMTWAVACFWMKAAAITCAYAAMQCTAVMTAFCKCASMQQVFLNATM
eukprot:1159977-Pelagomonas_calceolata.AAC.2